MKKFLLTASLLFPLCFVFAQIPTAFPYDFPSQTQSSQLKTSATQNFPLAEMRYDWNATAQKWDSSYYSVYQRYPDGQISQITQQTASGGVLTNSFLTMVTRDAQGRVTEEVSQTWTGSAWENDSRTNSVYDAPGNLTSFTVYGWSNNAWDTLSSYQNAFTYYSGNLERTRVRSNWNSTTRVYDLQSQSEYSLDNAMQIDSILFYNWNGTSWDTSSLNHNYVWADFPNRIFSEYDGQVFTGSGFENSFRLHVVQGNNNIEDDYYLNWNGTAFDSLYWQRSQDDQYGNDVLFEYREWTGQTWFDSYLARFNNTYTGSNQLMEVIIQIYSNFSGQYENSTRSVFSNFFVDRTEAVESVSFATLYPNPSREEAHLLLSLDKPQQIAVRISDLQGRVLSLCSWSHPGGQSEMPLSLENLPAGTYLYEVLADGAFNSGKLIVE